MKSLNCNSAAILFSVALVTLSCTERIDSIDIFEFVKDSEVTLEARIASSDPETRTSRQSGGKVFWSPGDAISLFYGSGENGGNKFTSVCTEPEAVSNFTGTIGVITGGGEISMEQTYFWGVYPYSESTSCYIDTVCVVLPSCQKSAAGTFSDGQFPTVGRSQGLTMAFYNICGGIKFTVVHDDIRSVEFRNLSGGSLAGRMIVTIDEAGLPKVNSIVDGSDTIVVTPEEGKTFVPGTEYYVVIPPVVMSSGLEVTYKTLTKKATRTITSSVTITRSIFSKLTGKDEGLTFELRDDNVPFEDENFKSYCVENFDTDGDGEISFAEAQDVTEINCTSRAIESLEGIQYFLSLTDLNCQRNQLTSLDVSNNTALIEIACGNNQLTSLDVSKNPALEYISCSNEYFMSNGYFNQLTSLDVSKNTALIELRCRNNQLTSLDVSNNTALEHINCGNNQLTSLDVSKNTSLEQLACGGNQLTSIDVSMNTALVSIDCSDNQLTSVDVSKNTSLEQLACSGNQLTSIDVSMNTALVWINCSDNQLTSVDVSKNPALEYICCDNNQLMSLDVRKNPALIELWCQNTQLTNLDVSKNTALVGFGCGHNQLTSIDVSKNTAMEVFFCDNNQLTSIDVSKNTALVWINCSDNQLTSLDVDKNSELGQIDCYCNQLTSLDVSKNTVLMYLHCAPMDTFDYLYIGDGQYINNVTENRSEENIPSKTVILIAPADGGGESTGDGGEIE